MTDLDFCKGHATGNDFVILPDPDGTLDLPAGLVTALCDRRFGLGGDGLLRVVRSARHPETADRPGPQPEWFMDYRNADGSVAEMCGNGIRVFVRYLLAVGLASGPDVPVLTRAGPVAASVTGGEITVGLRPPRVLGESVAQLPGRELVGTAVDCGNPHLVCPLPADLDLAQLDLTAPPTVDDAFFPAGANVEFIVTAGTDVRMRVYERGVGETCSCGSGACAAVAVARLLGAPGPGPISVVAPGGRLTVTLTERGCALRGPAMLVARGTVERQALAGGPAGDSAGGNVAALAGWAWQD